MGDVGHGDRADLVGDALELGVVVVARIGGVAAQDDLRARLAGHPPQLVEVDAPALVGAGAVAGEVEERAPCATPARRASGGRRAIGPWRAPCRRAGGTRDRRPGSSASPTAAARWRARSGRRSGRGRAPAPRGHRCTPGRRNSAAPDSPRRTCWSARSRARPAPPGRCSSPKESARPRGAGAALRRRWRRIPRDLSVPTAGGMRP